MKNTKELLGSRIRELRKARSFTQEQLAELVDVEQKHISRIEVGKNFPTIDRLEKIAAALNVPLSVFFDFMHHAMPHENAESLEEMLTELDDESRKTAYKIIKGVIMSLRQS